MVTLIMKEGAINAFANEMPRYLYLRYDGNTHFFKWSNRMLRPSEIDTPMVPGQTLVEIIRIWLISPQFESIHFWDEGE
jgi:hypothetical protein